MQENSFDSNKKCIAFHEWLKNETNNIQYFIFEKAKEFISEQSNNIVDNVILDNRWHYIDRAKKHGYKAMQFNYVISTNKVAVNLWQSLGFNIIGTVPQAHSHQGLNKLVDIHIMHKSL